MPNRAHTDVKDNHAESRYEVRVDGELAGFATALKLVCSMSMTTALGRPATMPARMMSDTPLTTDPLVGLTRAERDRAERLAEAAGNSIDRNTLTPEWAVGLVRQQAERRFGPDAQPLGETRIRSEFTT